MASTKCKTSRSGCAKGLPGKAFGRAGQAFNARSTAQKDAQTFIDFVMGDGRKILNDYGFQSP
jgi:hypothetical protein